MGARHKVTRMKRGKEQVEWGRGSGGALAREGGLYLDICTEAP